MMKQNYEREKRVPCPVTVSLSSSDVKQKKIKEFSHPMFTGTCKYRMMQSKPQMQSQVRAGVTAEHCADDTVGTRVKCQTMETLVCVVNKWTRFFSAISGVYPCLRRFAFFFFFFPFPLVNYKRQKVTTPK